MHLDTTIRTARFPRATRIIAATAALLLSLSACADGKAPRFSVSSNGSEFKNLSVKPGKRGKADLVVHDEAVGPALEGFGGAFNEKGWDALKALSPEDRSAVLENIFVPGKGLSLGFNRIPIGSSDYALSRYSLAPVENDWSMASFSIARDREALIPYIRAAQALNPSMRFWGSAWSPPPWLKTNNSYDSGQMLDDPKAYAAYALYLVKFAEAYGAEKIRIEAVAVQNEPYILTAYPSCKWDPEQYRVFIRDHLGPALERSGSGAGVMLGTFNQANNRAHAMAALSDPAARKYVKVLGLQWSGIDMVSEVKESMPELPVWHTETDCGNHHWEPGFNPDKPQNDFAYAAYTWGLMRDYLAADASLYTLWNIVLDQNGKSIDAFRPWPQNSAIVVDTAARRVLYTPMYYAFSSFSRFLPPGSRRLKAEGTRDALAFALPSGGKAVVLMNARATARKMTVDLNGKAYSVELPARSFGTLLAE